MNGKFQMRKNNLILVRDVIILGIMIISLSVFLTVNFTGFYHLFVIHDNLGKVIGMSNRELMSNYDALIRYLQCGWIAKWNTTIPSSTAGLTHFADVKRLIEFNNLILLFFGSGAIFVLKKRIDNHQMWQLILPVKMGLTILGTSIFILIATFNRSFIIFHEILFRNRDWIFNPQTDPIIKVLPESFFEGCFVLVILICILCGSLIIAYGRKELKKAR